MLSLNTERLFFLSIKDNDVSVRTHCNRALLWEQTKHLSCCCRRQFDKSIQTDPIFDNTTVVDQRNAVLDTGRAVRDLSEVVNAQLLLFLHAKWTMVSRDH